MARQGLTKSKAEEYQQASKKRKGQILDSLCEDIGWSRDNARRQLKRSLTCGARRKSTKTARTLKGIEAREAQARIDALAQSVGLKRATGTLLDALARRGFESLSPGKE
jgi:hypothetical protein